MTTKKGSGGSIPPGVRPAAPASRPQPKRPQLRPIGGPKPPAMRPLANRKQAPPKAAAPSEKLPSLASSTHEDDATNVMARPGTLDLPPAASKGTLRSLTESQRPPATNRLAAGRPVRPDIDIVPKTQWPTAERTAVMPNAPARATSPVVARSPSRPPLPTERLPDAPGAVVVRTVPPAQPSPRLRDETVAIFGGSRTPSAPPMAMGPAVQARPLSAWPPPNVRTRPPSVAPPAHFAQPSRPPIIDARRAETPGVFGFVLFAAPLALALAIIAALALL